MATVEYHKCVAGERFVVRQRMRRPMIGLSPHSPDEVGILSALATIMV